MTLFKKNRIYSVQESLTGFEQDLAVKFREDLSNLVGRSIDIMDTVDIPKKKILEIAITYLALSMMSLEVCSEEQGLCKTFIDAADQIKRGVVKNDYP